MSLTGAGLKTRAGALRRAGLFGIVLGMGHESNDARSLAYHRAIAEHLVRDPDLVRVAKERVTAWQRNDIVAAYYVDHWTRLLSLPLLELTAALVEPTELGCALRQVSPFAGVLSPRERWAIWWQTRPIKAAS